MKLSDIKDVDFDCDEELRESFHEKAKVVKKNRARYLPSLEEMVKELHEENSS